MVDTYVPEPLHEQQTTVLRGAIRTENALVELAIL
jgi:hypothetical protein